MQLLLQNLADQANLRKTVHPRRPTGLRPSAKNPGNAVDHPIVEVEREPIGESDSRHTPIALWKRLSHRSRNITEARDAFLALSASNTGLTRHIPPSYLFRAVNDAADQSRRSRH